MSPGRYVISTDLALRVLAETTSGLTVNIFSGLGDLFRDRPLARWVVGILSSLWLVIALVVGVYAKAGPIVILERPLSLETILPLLVAPSFVAGFMLLAILVSLGKASDNETLLNRLLRDTREPGHKSQDTSPSPEQQTKVFDILSVIESNLDQLIDYYIINKAQANTSFRASIISISVGFLTIIVGVWLAYASGGDKTAAYISVAAGIMLQFIGGTFFFLYNKSLIQLNFFFARLALMQDTMLGIRLADSIPDGKEKRNILEKLIFAIVQRNVAVPNLHGSEARKILPNASTAAKKPTEAQRD